MTQHSYELYSRDELSAKFGWEEYVVISLLLAFSAAVGVFFWWRGQKDNNEFLLGGRQVGTLPICLSLLTRYCG